MPMGWRSSRLKSAREISRWFWRRHEVLAGIGQLDFGFKQVIERCHPHLVIVDSHFRLGLQHGDGFFGHHLELLGFEQEEINPLGLEDDVPTHQRLVKTGCVQPHLGQSMLIGQSKAGKQGLGDAGHEGVLLLGLHDP